MQEDGDEEEKEGGTPGVNDVKVDQKEEKKAPEMGCNSEQASSSDKKAEGSTRSTPEKRRRHVMIDFHNTIDIGNAIPPANHAAVEKLLLAKHPVTICSWCFQKRKQEVIDTLKGQTLGSWRVLSASSKGLGMVARPKYPLTRASRC